MRVDIRQRDKLQQSERDQLTQDSTDLSYVQQANRLAVLGYLLYALGIVFGVTALIGVIVNHTCIERTKQTIAYSHCKWQIISFWVLFAGLAATVMMWHASIGKLIAGCCFVWWLVSLLIGIWFLAARKPIPWIRGVSDPQHG